MKKLKLANEGFTIIEGIVGLTVTVVLLMILMNFMADFFRSQSINTVRSELLVNSQRALDRIGEDIRLSAAADLNNRWPDPYAPGAPANQFSWQSNATRLILATAAEDNDGDIIFADPAQYISEKNNNVYFVSGGNLYKRVLASPIAGNSASRTCPKAQATPTCEADTRLAENVQTFSITYLNGEEEVVQPADARAIELRLVLQSNAYGKTVSADYTTRMVFRND